MSTVEILFGNFFERKNSVIEQLNQQKDLYDQYLASTSLINGIRPPSWLLKDGFEAGSSQLKELKNEDLISGLLFPPFRPNYPSSIGSKTFYSRSIFTANTVKQLSGDFYSETCASNKYYSVGERSADIPNCLLDGKNIELETTLNTVPELDNTIFSPQNQTDLTNHFDVTTVGERSTVDPKCNLNGSSFKSECTFNTITQQGGTTGTPQCQTDLKVFESSFELPPSLVRIQRSRSRQRALELRNSASGKSRKRAIQESNAAAGRPQSDDMKISEPKQLLFGDAEDSEHVETVQSAITSFNGWENSWPQCNRRKIEGQSDKGFTTCPRIWSAKHNHHEDIVGLYLNSAEAGSGTDPEFQQFPVSGVVESSIIESAVGEMSNGAKHLVSNSAEASPKQLLFGDAEDSEHVETIQSAITSFNGWENSWPQCKRRKIEGQSDKGFTTCPRIWSAKHNLHEDIVGLNLNSAEVGSGTDPEFQQFPVSGVVESSIIESAVGEMSNGAKHLVMEGVQCSPEIHADEAEVDGGFVLGDAIIPLGFKPMLLESSLGSSGIKVEDTGIHLNEVEEQYPFSVAMSLDRQCLPQYKQKFFCFESEKTPRSMGEVCSTEQDIQDIKSNLEEQLLSNYDNLDVVGADQSMPEFEKFTDLPDTIIEGMSILEELCPTSSMGTPYSLPSKSKFQMDLSTWSGYNPLEPGRSYSDFMPSSSDQSECDAWSPYTSQVGKAAHTILSSSGGQRSKKQRSTSSELTPIHEDSSSGGEENRNLCKVLYQLQEKSSAIEMKSSTYREPLVDISNINPLDFVSGNEKIFERGSLVDSLEEDANPHGSEIGSSKNSKDDFGTERKYKNKDEENKSSSLCGYGTEMKYMNKDRESKSSSICGTGTRKSTRCLQNTVSKPNLRRKATVEKRDHTIVDKGQVGSNIATGVKSFTDLLKNAVLPAKRKVPKVKALDLAKETKKQEEEKKKQREMMKEKLERERERQKEEKAREEELNQRQKEEKGRKRERLKEEKARQQELIQKRKEVEAQRKEAEMQERKRLREDEKKEKDRKKVRKEPQKKLPAGKEEKELKYRAADEKASKKKGFQDEEMKDLNPEKVKAREECAKGRQTRAKKPSGVHEHSVALKESHSNENAVNCFGQVNEVGSLATGGTLEQSYDISPYQSSDGEEDDDVPTRKVVPSWSRQYCPAPLSCSQQPKNIFKLSSFCDIYQVLKSRKSSK